ncbi:MAG: hypothetical protein BGO47_06920 [Microbacterium sp. 67-17]|nr:MAG: hypothetical protein BGO47_06920 [Microbacterium sp. 67-17]
MAFAAGREEALGSAADFPGLVVGSNGRSVLELAGIARDADGSHALNEAMSEFVDAVDMVRQRPWYGQVLAASDASDIQVTLLVFDSVNVSVELPRRLHQILVEDHIELWFSAI